MSKFTAKFNVTGARRKELVNHISEVMECPSVYKFAPTFNYEVDYITIDRNGTVSFDDWADTEQIERLLDHLDSHGFSAEREETEEEEPAESESPAQNESTGLTFYIPKDKVNVKLLRQIVKSKSGLIQKALGLEALPIEEDSDEIVCPWFSDISELNPDEIKAYTNFIGKLSQFSVNAKRVSMKEKAVDNEKYAFRCFLLRLGFIGADYKTDRKILLKNLEGSSAFKNGGADNENA